MMQVWGAKCIPSRVRNRSGPGNSEKNANTPGSLGIAISEAMEAAVADRWADRYALEAF